MSTITVNVGSHIGSYEVLSLIGAGGMGSVYLGQHTLLKRRAAIKTILPTSRNPDAVERFINEARAASSASDPGVVQIFDFGYHTDGTAFIVMEYLEGEGLDARIARLGCLSVVDALRLARQLAGSLSTLHACGILHRDLKPENLFVVPDPEAQGGERTKILDFGIATLIADSSSTTTPETVVVGTPVYMAPEQSNGCAEPRSDLYSLGCVLFHMLTGAPPFDRASNSALLAAHLFEPAPAPSSVVPTIPPAVDWLVLRCLAKTPEDRFSSMSELQAALGQALSDLGVPRTSPGIEPAPSATRPPSVSRPLPRPTIAGRVPIRPSGSKDLADGSSLTALVNAPTTLGLANNASTGWAIAKTPGMKALATLAFVVSLGIVFSVTSRPRALATESQAADDVASARAPAIVGTDDAPAPPPSSAAKPPERSTDDLAAAPAPAASPSGARTKASKPAAPRLAKGTAINAKPSGARATSSKPKAKAAKTKAAAAAWPAFDLE